LNVLDDQSVVITDYYSEQIKTGHATLTGTGAHLDGPGGRVTVAAVKSNCYTPHEVTVDNYHGTLFYSSSFFFEGPPVIITQRGGADVNLTFLGNAFYGDNASALTFDVTAAAHVSTVANLLADYGSAVEPGGQTKMYPDQSSSVTNGTISTALGDFRRLGQLDLVLNHPAGH